MKIKLSYVIVGGLIYYFMFRKRDVSAGGAGLPNYGGAGQAPNNSTTWA